MDSFLEFPPYEMLVRFLEQHPRTNNSYLKEKGMIEAAARAFADRKIAANDVQDRVIIAMHYFNEKVNYPEQMMDAISMNFTKALKSYGPIKAKL